MSFQIPIMHHYCVCTDDDFNPTPLGHRQKEYELLRMQGLSFYDTMEIMGIKRLCCREKMFNPTFLFLNNADIGRIRDDTGFLAKKDKIKIVKEKTIKSGEEILPKRPLPELPM